MRKPFVLPNYEPESTAPLPPIEVLRDAAASLTARTNRRVEGSVFTGSLGGTGVYRHTFYLRAPALDDFTDPLFYAWHGAELYPVNVCMAGSAGDKAGSFADENALHDEVQRILTSEVARQRIGAMLAQVGRRSRTATA